MKKWRIFSGFSLASAVALVPIFSSCSSHNISDETVKVDTGYYDNSSVYISNKRVTLNCEYTTTIETTQSDLYISNIFVKVQDTFLDSSQYSWDRKTLKVNAQAITSKDLTLFVDLSVNNGDSFPIVFNAPSGFSCSNLFASIKTQFSTDINAPEDSEYGDISAFDIMVGDHKLENEKDYYFDQISNTTYKLVVRGNAITEHNLSITPKLENKINVAIQEDPSVYFDVKPASTHKNYEITLKYIGTDTQKDISDVHVSIVNGTETHNLTIFSDYTYDGNTLKINGSALVGTQLNITYQVVTKAVTTSYAYDDPSRFDPALQFSSNLWERYHVILDPHFGFIANEVEVSVGGVKLNKSQFTFNPSLGSIIIDSSFMFSTQVNINVIQSGPISFGFELHLKGVEGITNQPIAYMQNPTFVPGQEYNSQILFVSNAYYFASDDIIVSPVAIKGEDYTFDRQTGLISFTASFTQYIADSEMTYITIEISCGADILTCQANEEDSALSLNTYGKCNPNLYFSRDGVEWAPLQANKYVSLASQSKIYLYGNNSDGWSQNEGNYATITCIGNISIEGNLSSLIIDESADRMQEHTIPCDYCFFKLFYSSYGLIDGPDLLFDSFPEHSCESMFENCGQLINTPLFNNDVITLHKYALKKMFYNCVRLTAFDNMKCSVDEFSCDHMFANCTQLETTNDFNNEGVAYQGSFSHMFDGCINLKETYLNIHSWRNNAIQACEYMFYNCKSLSPRNISITLDSLQNNNEVTSLADKSCFHMFDGCLFFQVAPEIDARGGSSQQSLAYMFANCFNLQICNDLGIIELTDSSKVLEGMFWHCKKLSSIRLTQYRYNFDSNFVDWVNGVAANGFFYYSPEREEYIRYGKDAIPTNWTIMNEV